MQKIIIGLIVIVAIVGVVQLNKKEKSVDKNTTIKVSEIKEKIVIPKTIPPKITSPIPIPLHKKESEKKLPETIEDIPKDMTYEDFQKKEIKNFHSMQSQMNTAISKIPDCLAQASTKEEAFACNQKLLEIAKKMMPDGNLTPELEHGYDENFTWNEEKKIKMIQAIDDNTAPMQDITTCVNTSKDTDEMEECLKMLKEENISK